MNTRHQSLHIPMVLPASPSATAGGTHMHFASTISTGIGHTLHLEPLPAKHCSCIAFAAMPTLTISPLGCLQVSVGCQSTRPRRVRHHRGNNQR